jgi:membrane-bound lytic murein transglycosylase D
VRQLWYTIIVSTMLLLSLSVAIASPNIEGIQVFQKNTHLTEARKQLLADDINRYHHAEDMWDVLRSEFVLPHYEDNPYVQQQIEWFMNHQDYLRHSANRAAPYLYYILQQAHKRHLPVEVVLLPMIESAYNPFAYSSAGAAGIWQMMPGTASGFGIKQNWWYDGRRDVVASTKAALDYLVYLGGFFDGNWMLAIAAYDTGEGNVLSAIRRNNRDGKSTDFWSLPVAQETREYIPRLLALATIIANPDEYPVDFPRVRNAPYLAQVDVGGQIDLQHAATLAGLSLTKLKQFNSGYNRAATDPNGPYKLVLPMENVEQFTENLMQSPQYRRARWQHYKVHSGESLQAVANKFNTSPAALRQVNALSSNTVKPGLNLMVPYARPAISKSILKSEQRYMTAKKTDVVSSKTTAKQLAKSILKNLHGRYVIQSGDTLYMVREGDNLQKIADHFRTDVKTLLAVNRLSMDSTLDVGTKLVIPTHLSKDAKYQIAPGDTIYVVRKGDTLEKIAQRFNVAPHEIRLVNVLASNEVREGDHLVIPTHG